MRKLVLNIDPALWHRLRVLAAEQDRTATSIVTEAITKVLEREEKKGGKP